MRHSPIVRSCARRLRAAARQDGFTLVELIVTMAILLTVVTALTATFASAMNSEADMNNRFRAQVNARLGLAKLTRELHCANQILQSNGSPLAATPVAGITLTLPGGCPTGGASAITVSWCAVANAGKWDLYRYPVGGCPASGGIRWAESLTGSVPFSLPAATTSGAHYPLVHVDLRANTRTSGTLGSYNLITDIAALNAVRS